jgi:hypothetical protein
MAGFNEKTNLYKIYRHIPHISEEYKQTGFFSISISNALKQNEIVLLHRHFTFRVSSEFRTDSSNRKPKSRVAIVTYSENDSWCDLETGLKSENLKQLKKVYLGVVTLS